MNVTIQNMGPCCQEWRVTVPTETARPEYDRFLDTFCRNARIEGFRPGRAPRDIVARKFATELAANMTERLSVMAFRAAIDRAGVSPLRVLKANASSWNGGSADWEAHFIVEVPPQFDLPPYKGLELRRARVVVEDAEVDQALEQVRRRLARYEAVTDRGAETEDILLVSFEATLEGRPVTDIAPQLSDLVKANDFWLPLEEERGVFPQAFHEAHLGARAGETRSFHVTFPEDYWLPALRGKTLHYQSQVKEVRRPVLPELTSSWTSQLGFETMDALRAKLRSDLENTRRRQAELDLRNELWTKLVEAVQMDMPASELAFYTRVWTAQIVSDLIRSGMAEAEIRKRAKEIETAAHERAERYLRVRFLAERIAVIEQITVSEKEIQEAIERQAAREGKEAAEVRRQLEEDHALADFRTELLIAKVTDFLLGQAHVEEV